MKANKFISISLVLSMVLSLMLGFSTVEATTEKGKVEWFVTDAIDITDISKIDGANGSGTGEFTSKLYVEPDSKVGKNIMKAIEQISDNKVEADDTDKVIMLNDNQTMFTWFYTGMYNDRRRAADLEDSWSFFYYQGADEKYKEILKPSETYLVKGITGFNTDASITGGTGAAGVGATVGSNGVTVSSGSYENRIDFGMKDMEGLSSYVDGHLETVSGSWEEESLYFNTWSKSEQTANIIDVPNEVKKKMDEGKSIMAFVIPMFYKGDSPNNPQDHWMGGNVAPENVSVKAVGNGAEVKFKNGSQKIRDKSETFGDYMAYSSEKIPWAMRIGDASTVKYSLSVAGQTGGILEYNSINYRNVFLQHKTLTDISAKTGLPASGDLGEARSMIVREQEVSTNIMVSGKRDDNVPFYGLHRWDEGGSMHVSSEAWFGVVFVEVGSNPKAPMILFTTDDEEGNEIPVNISSGEKATSLEECTISLKDGDIRTEIKDSEYYWDPNWIIDCSDFEWAENILEVRSIENPDPNNLSDILKGLNISDDYKEKHFSGFKSGDNVEVNVVDRTYEKTKDTGGELGNSTLKYVEMPSDMTGTPTPSKEKPVYKDNASNKNGSEINNYYNVEYTDSVIYIVKLKRNTNKEIKGVAYTFKDETGKYVDGQGKQVSSPVYNYVSDIVTDEQGSGEDKKTYWDVNWNIKMPIWGSTIMSVSSIENKLDSEYIERPGKTNESKGTLGWGLDIEANPVSVVNAVKNYVESPSVPVGDSSLKATDGSKTGSDTNHYYDLDETDSIVYEVMVLRTPPIQDIESSGDVTLYQDQISRKIKNYDLGLEVVTGVPTWLSAVGSHSSTYYICRSAWDGKYGYWYEVCSFPYTSYCGLHNMLDPVYYTTWWSNINKLNNKIIAGKNNALSYGFGLYVKHYDNDTGLKNYSITDWQSDRLNPYVDFVLWRQENLPTIAKYKRQTIMAIADNADGLGLKKGKEPVNVTEKQDYTRTTTFQLSQTDERNYRVGSFNYTADKLRVVASCEALSGHGGGTYKDIGTHIGTIQTNMGTNTTTADIKVYSGGTTKLANDKGSLRVSMANLSMADREVKTILNGVPQAIGGLSSFSYYPYVLMNYESLTIDKTDIYVLSSYKSTWTPQNYIEYGSTYGVNEVDNGEGKESLKLTSKMFSTHATAKKQSFYKVDNVLPGGALYQLSNPDNKADLPILGVTTYQYFVELPDGATTLDDVLVDIVGNTDVVTKEKIEIKHKDMMDKLISDIRNPANGIREYVIGQSTYNATGLRSMKFWEGAKVVKGGTISVGGRNIKIQTDDKYYLKNEQSALEVFNSSGAIGYDEKQTEYLIKSDTDGNIMLFKDGSEVNRFGKTVTGATIISSLDAEWKLLDDKTKLVTNYVNVTFRNKGSDENGDTWFNEAFDGIGIMKIESSFSVGLNESKPNPKIVCLDPVLSPKQSSKSDIYTKYYKFGWAINNDFKIKIDFDNKVYELGQADELLKLRTRGIYSPNAAVTDLGK